MQAWQEEILKKWDKKPKIVLVTDEIRDRLAREFKGEVKYREPLASHTSIRIGGIADVFLRPSSIEDIRTVFQIAHEEAIPVTFFGSGSNVLVRDQGIRGFVIHLKGLNKCSRINETDVLAEAGCGITALVYFFRDQGLTGMEELVGIPGSIGGAVVMNAGARGREIGDLVREITIMDGEGTLQTMPREKLEFSYRHLKLPKTFFVISALFRLEIGDPVVINERVKEFQKKRAETQPLNFPNLGSIFKNPPPARKKDPPLYAAQLIEEAGLKAIRVGGARISEKHSNFIVNENGATAKDVLVLVNLIKDKVKEKMDISLETEIRILGEDS